MTANNTLYHWTFNAENILKLGFRGDLGTQGGRHFRDDGVWFSDKVLDQLEGVEEGMELLVIEVPFEDIEEFEWKEEGKDYREWCIPADVVNQYGKPILTEVSKDIGNTSPNPYGDDDFATPPPK